MIKKSLLKQGKILTIVAFLALDKAILVHMILHVSHNQVRMLPIEWTDLTLVAFHFSLILECCRRITILLRQILLGNVHLVLRMQNLVLLQIQRVGRVVVTVAALD